MKDIFVTVILTTKCNLRCTYCINSSGQDLIPHDARAVEWGSGSEVLECLENLARIRNIKMVKFYGGEPTLREDLILDIMQNKERYSKNGNVKYAFTTNGYKPFSAELLKVITDNRTIVNLSLDGPEKINNCARIPLDKGNCFEAVLRNVKLLQEAQYPFALIGVLDERILEYDETIKTISDFFSTLCPVYKLEPAYVITESHRWNDSESKISQLLAMEEEFIADVFTRIKNLDPAQYIYENNVARTIHNIVFDTRKEYVCSAAELVTIYPDKRAYSCYNLQESDYFICDDVSKVDPLSLEHALRGKRDLLRIENFPEQYREIEYFGDYCPKENNFNSFAYLYRKNMIECLVKELNTIEPGSPEHLSLVAFLSHSFTDAYFELGI